MNMNLICTESWDEDTNKQMNIKQRLTTKRWIILQQIHINLVKIDNIMSSCLTHTKFMFMFIKPDRTD